MNRSSFLAFAALSVGTVAAPRFAQAQRTTTRANASPVRTVTTSSSSAPPSSTNAAIAPQPPSSPAPLAVTAPDVSLIDMPVDPNAHSVSLGEAVAIARRDPPSVLLALARIHTAESQVPLVRASLLPTFAGNASIGANGSNGSTPVQGFGTVNQTLGQLTFDTNVGGRWTFFDFGRTSLNVDAAQLGVQVARMDANSVTRLAVTNAASAYFTALADQQLVASATQVVQQRQREADIARGLVEGGARPPIEQTRAEVGLQTAQLELTNAITSLNNDLAALAATLAIDPSHALAIVQPPLIAVDDDPAHAAAESERTRPEVATARLQLQQAEVQLSAARAGYRPSLNAAATVGVRYNLTARSTVDSMGMPVTNVTNGPSEYATASVGLAVPIWDPVLNANIRLNEASVATARASLAQVVLNARTDAVQAAIGVRAARQAVQQAERLAAGAAANLAQAEGRYQAGAAPVLELVDAQASDATARLAVIRARWQFELSKVRLLGAIGHLDVLSAR